MSARIVSRRLVDHVDADPCTDASEDLMQSVAHALPVCGHRECVCKHARDPPPAHLELDQGMPAQQRVDILSMSGAACVHRLSPCRSDLTRRDLYVSGAPV